jgi:hypothetical protein
MKRFTLALVVLAVFTFAAFFDAPARAASLPEVVFLGEGPGTFTTPLDNFVVKLVPFDFDWQPGPTLEANAGQRVWGVRGTNEKPPKLWHEEVNLGTVKAGCISKYVGIDDDVDGRINFFTLDGEVVETVKEGMVFRGSFVIPRDGNLTFVADDSVAGWFAKCDEQVQPTPTATAAATETATPGPSPTATATLRPGETVTPEPSPTAVVTALPTLELTPTATRRPRDHACLRVNFDVGGDEARRGLYVVQEIGGRFLASWYAESGWKDSGWIKKIDITHENVYVQVLYYSGPGADPVEMKILNHAPDSPYGWLSWGICHALEVAWPDDVEPPAAAAQTAAEPVQADASAQQAPPPAEPTAAADVDDGSSPTTMGASLSSR